MGLAPEHELRAVAALSQGGLPSSPRCWPELARRYLLLVAAGSVASKEVEALGLIVRKFPGAPAKQLLVYPPACARASSCDVPRTRPAHRKPVHVNPACYCTVLIAVPHSRP